MAGVELLNRLQASGFELALEPPDNIRVSPASQLTPELRDAIRNNKAVLLQALRDQPEVDLLGLLERPAAKAATVVLDGPRTRLFVWALHHGCPELRFRRWASVVGSPTAWVTFLQTASDEDVLAALEAADAESARD